MRARLLLAGALLVAGPLRGQTVAPVETHFQTTLYMIGASMVGTTTVRGIPVETNVGFDQILDHLQFGAMGEFRVEHGRWAGMLNVVFMGLGASTDHPPATVDLDQWVVELDGSYTILPWLEGVVGVRYNSLSGEVAFQGPLGTVKTAKQDWTDPVFGVQMTFPLGGKFSLHARGDIGGFGVGSRITWQAYLNVGYRISESGSRMYVGYRALYNDYSTGSGNEQFRYDVRSGGPEAGLSLRF